MSKILQTLLSLATNTPDHPAIRGDHLTLDWAQLQSEVDALTRQLQDTQTLGLLMQNDPAWVVTDLAALQAGICHVPLPPFFSDEQITHAVNDAGIDTLVTDAPERLSQLLTVQDAREITIAGRTCHLLTCRPARDSAVTNGTVKVTYTSGTTGTPRGVRLGADTIDRVAQSLMQAAQAGTADRALAMLPLSTLLENIGSVYVPILCGAQMLIPSPSALGLAGSSRIEPAVLAGALQLLQPTTMILPPQLLKLVVGLAAQGQLPDSFRYIAVGGAPVSSALLNAAQALRLPVFQGYGLSEACSVVTVNTPADNRPGAVGKPLPHARVRIAADGEVRVSGALFQGYLNDAPVDDTELGTGDLGHLDEDGYLYITGRRRNLIITGYGRNVSPEWVESELLAHPDIAQAAVFGDGRPYLVAVLAPATPAASTEQALAQMDLAIQAINQHLPDYARIREFILADAPFSVQHDELTSNGRPRRDVIGERYQTRITQCYEVSHEQVL